VTSYSSRILTAIGVVLLTVVLVFGIAGHRSSLPRSDSRVPASSSPWAPCPKGDAGRVKDAALLHPAQWVCVRGQQ
jgi:hypothetical protein